MIAAAVTTRSCNKISPMRGVNLNSGAMVRMAGPSQPASSAFIAAFGAGRRRATNAGRLSTPSWANDANTDLARIWTSVAINGLVFKRYEALRVGKGERADL